MAQFVISTDVEPVKVQAFGNWFEFKPGQIKWMQTHFADFLAFDKRQLGFVAIPDSYEDLEQRETPEMKATIAAAIEQGRQNIAKECERIIHNLEVSMQKDLDMANIKVSAVHLSGKEHLPVYRKLAALKKVAVADNSTAMDEIAALKGTINGTPQSGNPSPAPAGRETVSKPTGPRE